MSKKLLGMGTGAVDTFITCPALPKEDAFQQITSEQLIPGGSCANMLCAFAALGGSAQMIAKIGDDQFGREFSRSLTADNVDNSRLLIKPGGTTLHTYVWAAAGGEHCILVNLGDSLMDLQPEEIDETLLDGVDLFYTDLFPAAAAIKVAQMCKQKDIPVIVCLECPPSFMRSCGLTDAEITTAISLADLLISGREGYLELTGNSDYQQALAATYQKFEPPLGAICTAGSEGAIWVDAKETIQVPAYQVQAIDSTGAGDSFLGGFLYSYFVAEDTKEQAMRFASAVGALKCLQHGPRIKTNPSQVNAFMEQNR